MAKVVHRFLTGAMKPGDVLLTAVPSGKVSKVVRAATRSDFSHALICYQPPEFLEAVGAGVVRCNLYRFLVNDIRNVRMLRLKTESDPTGLIARRAAENAGKYFGNGYWFDGVRCVLSNESRRRKQAKVFCSDLVATLYYQLGCYLVPGKQPAKVTPEDLAQSDMLEPINELVLEAIDYEIAALWGVALDENQPRSPHREEVQTSRKLLARVNRALISEACPQQDNFHQLLNLLRDLSDREKQLRLDAVVACALKEGDYLTTTARRLPANHPSFHLSKVLRADLQAKKLSTAQIQDSRHRYEEAQAMLAKDRADKRWLLAWYENAYEFRRLETFRILAEHQAGVCAGVERIAAEVQQCRDLLR